MSSLRTAFFVLLVTWSCSDSGAGLQVLRQVDTPVAPAFRHKMPADSSYYMPESAGSGIAFLDFDSDGDLDVYAVNGAGRVDFGDSRVTVNQLFRRNSD